MAIIIVTWLLFLYLYTLVSIGHHSNEEINQHNDRHQHVNAENAFKKHFRPVRLVVRVFDVRVVAGTFQIVGGGLAEYREKQQIKSTDWILLDWKNTKKEKLVT